MKPDEISGSVDQIESKAWYQATQHETPRIGLKSRRPDQLTSLIINP